jgi:hypothetical protein
MSFGKSGGTTVQTAELTPEQRQQIAAQTGFFTGTIAPAYQQAVSGAGDIYNYTIPGATAAAQNAATISGQAQETLGATGESALRSGISGLQGLFSQDYEQQQLQAALMPAQAQYQQNLAALGAGFGGAGQIGSARQALAQTQLAGATQATQAQTAAKVMADIAAQRQAAAGNLAQLGQAGLGGAQTAAQQQVALSQVPQDVYNKYASVIFGTPAAAWNPNFAGTQGSTTTANKSQWGISI